MGLKTSAIRDLKNECQWSDILTLETVDIETLQQACTESYTHVLKSRCAWLLAKRNGTVLSPHEHAAPRGFPVLTSGKNNQGGIGFIQVVENGAASQDADCAAALQCVDKWWQSLGQKVDSLAVSKDELPPGTNGPSLGLSIIMASLSIRCGVRWPRDLAASASVVVDEKGRAILKSVECLQAKAQAARLNGYTRILVAEGQICPDSEGIKWIAVPTDLVELLVHLLQYALGTQGILGMLACLDVSVRDRQFEAGSQLEDLLPRFVEKKYSASIRCFAASILTRMKLHRGDADAYAYARKSAECRAEAVKEHGLNAVIMEHLKNNLPAEQAVAAIDAGHWEGDIWKQLARVECRMLDTKEEGIDTPSDTYALLIAVNTRARKDSYHARLHDNAEGLETAWQETLPFTDSQHNTDVYTYAQFVNKRDTTLHRQWNQCLDHYLAYYDMQGAASAWDIAGCWVFDENPQWEKSDYYDPHYYLRISAIHDKTVCADRQKEIYQQAGFFHPGFIIYESFMQHADVYPDYAKKSAACLDAHIRKPENAEKGNSILSLLRLRTWALCEQARKRGMLDTPSLPFPEPQTPWTPALETIAEKMIPVHDRIDPMPEALSRCISRCPY